MKKQLRIKNSTHWSTRDLRRFVIRAMDLERRKYATVSFVYSRHDNGYVGGYAWYNSNSSVIKLPRSYVDQRDLAHTLCHELAHNAGLRHRDMKGDSRYQRIGEWRQRYEWAAGLPLTKLEPKAKPKRGAPEKLEHCQEMLKIWTAKVKRAQTGAKNWQTKIRYYERQLTVAAKRSK